MLERNIERLRDVSHRYAFVSHLMSKTPRQGVNFDSQFSQHLAPRPRHSEKFVKLRIDDNHWTLHVHLSRQGIKR